MTYRIDPSHFIENGPTLTAVAAIARIHRAALHAALAKRKSDEEPAALDQAA